MICDTCVRFKHGEQANCGVGAPMHCRAPNNRIGELYGETVGTPNADKDVQSVSTATAACALPTLGPWRKWSGKASHPRSDTLRNTLCSLQLDCRLK